MPGPNSLYKISQSSYSGVLLILFISIILVPIFGNFYATTISDLLRGFSRTYTINEAIDLIKAIENYEIDNNEYPESLSQLIPKYLDEIPKPKIIGVREFKYAKKDSIYELKFHQKVSLLSFNIEVVIYNPLGKQIGRGEMPTLYETNKINWKYFIFD